MNYKKKKIITFYSYKGGVGRSMALANIAWLFTTKLKKKVIIVDWDLEAPGLHRFFDFNDKDIDKGLIDLLLKFKNILSEEIIDDVANFIDIEEYLIDIISDNSNKGFLKILPAGKLDDEFAKKVNNFDWQDFYDKWNGYGIIEYIKAQLEDLSDYVLIDSRTGITDIGGICTKQLPNLVILCLIYNSQNIFGIESIAKKILNPKDNSESPEIMLLPTRVEEQEEIKIREEWEQLTYKTLSKYIDESIYANKRKYFLENKIPYIPYFSYGEKLAVKLFPEYEISKEYEKISEIIIKTLIKDLPKTPDWVLEIIENAREQNSNQIIIKEVKGLEKLSHFPIEIVELTQLKKITIKDCNLKIFPDSLTKLSNLENLILGNNSLTDISFINDLKGLKKLDLSINNVKNISSIKNLKNITELDLGGNQLSDISPLKELKNLMKLNLEYNRLNDISLLKNFNNLTVLNIEGNQLNDISPLKELKNLKKLNLGNNHLSDISPLKELENLTVLSIEDNKLRDISPIKELKNLTALFLKGNQISDISPIKELKNLHTLNLQKNPLEEILPWITDFNMEIQWEEYGADAYITFFDNPLKSPPPEIVKQGKEAARNYFQQLKEQEEDYLFEAKMLIVGEPGAGKTSMAWKMENTGCNLPKEEETTKGIDVRQYYFPMRKEDFPAFKYPGKLENRKFRVNIWDFGGQAIYKATHRFFLSKRSLYTLVADSRNVDTDFNYWLHIVEMFGGDSPLLIVLNEKYQRKRIIDIPAIRKRFPNISEVIHVDFAEKNKTRFDKLKRAVKYYISKLPHIGSPVPAKWTIIRETLEKEKRNTITLQDYMTICKKNGITKPKDALVLSQYFHDIGVFLHLQDDELLKKTIFLKPNWATDAVYKILDHDLLNQRNGRFDKEDAKVIWNEDEYMFVRDELLKLMQKFFLTYEIESSGEYIVPERLQQIQPVYPWDETDNLFLRYEYDLFMPHGIMSLFIVRLHHYVGDHDHVWKRGVVLEREKTFAEIFETYDARKINIRISGKNKRDFMTIITEEFDRINSQYEKMKVEKMIPCNCDKCKTGNKPFFFVYNKLKLRLDNNIYNIECENSYNKVNIRTLIDEVVNEEKLTISKRETMLKHSTFQPEEIKRDKVFVSYAHTDKNWLERVQTHLKVLENEGLSVNLWDDTKIKPGMNWREEIKKGLAAAKVAILLVSTDFLASDFIGTGELPHLLKAAENDGASILSLILKPCLFTMDKKLSKFQTINDPQTPLSNLTENEQDKILVKMAKRIAELMSETRAS